MHQLVTQKSHHKEQKLPVRLEPDGDLLMHKTMRSDNLCAFHEPATTSRQTFTLHNRFDGHDMRSKNSGELSARAALPRNQLSFAGPSLQTDPERLRSKTSRDPADMNPPSLRCNLERDLFKDSQANLHQPFEGSVFGKRKMFGQSPAPAKYIDVDRLPSKCSPPMLASHKDSSKPRHASFLSDQLASQHRGLDAPRTSQTSHQGDNHKEEDVVVKASTDSSNGQPVVYSPGKQSGIVLVEVCDRGDGAIQIEEGSSACIGDKLTKLLLQSEIRKADQEIASFQSTLSELSQAAERLKKSAEELIRDRNNERHALEARFERDLNSLKQQFEYESLEYKIIWKEVMDS